MLVACTTPAPELSETTSPLIRTSPASSYTFATPVEVGQTSQAAWVTVSPQGFNETYDIVSSVTESCADFYVSAPGLPASVSRECIEWHDCGQVICQPQALPTCLEWVTYTYDFQVFFRPTVATTTSCAVQVSTSGGQTITINFTGTGVPRPIDIDVTPASLAFGDVRVGQTSTAANLSVRNLGGSTLQVTSITVPAGFQVAGPTSYVVAPNGGVQNHAVTCTPGSVGTLSGTIKIASNDPVTPTTSISVSCRGTDSSLDITPSPAMIPATRVGEPVTHTITLRNSGTAAMTVQSVALTGTDLALTSAPSAGTILSPGAQATAQVQFAATTSGDTTGTLTVTYDGGRSRTAEISARALATSMALTPDGTIDLGPVCAGQARTQDLLVLANDQGSFQLEEVTAPEAPFSVDVAPLPLTVPGGGTTQVAIAITATPTDAGRVTATTTLRTDIPGAAPRDITLAVEGLPAGVSGTPAELEFGSSPIGMTTLGQNVSVTNCSGSDVELTNARIEGADADEFAIVLPPDSSTVEPSRTASWLVVSQPRTPGPKQALFSVDHPEGTVTIMLVGEGLGDGTDPDLGDDPGRASYYACSTGDASSAWPLVLALALVLGRRRSR